MARQLVIELIGDHKKLTKSLDEAGKQTKSFGDTIGNAGKKMTAFTTVPIVGFLGAATKAALDDAAAQEHLAKTMGNVGEGGQKAVAGVERWIGTAMKASTFTDDQLRPAFEQLILATGNADQALDLMQVSMDVAAGTGLDLETATKAVAKASEGQFTAVNRLIPGLLDLNDKTLTADKATAKLAELFRGQAAASAETAAGKAQNLKRDMGELAESIGAKLIPIVEAFVAKLNGLLTWLDETGIGADKLLIALLALAAAGPILKGIELATKAVAAAQWAWNAAVVAHPLVALIAVVAGLTVWLERTAGGVNGVKDSLSSWLNPLDDVLMRLRMWRDLLFDVGQKIRNLPGSGVLGNLIGKLPGFAVGGTIPGTPGMPVPIMAHGGEQIVSLRDQARGGGGGGTTVIVNVSGSLIAERDLGRVMADAFRDNALIGVG